MKLAEQPGKREEDVALFRFSIIGPVLHEDGKGQNKHFHQMSKKTYTLPDGTIRIFRWSTFKNWLNAYRKSGIEGLKPRVRSDHKRSRRIDFSLTDIIKELRTQYPFLSCSGVYRMLISEGHITPEAFSEQTLRKFMHDNTLSITPTDPIPRKKFEKEHINELWIADFMYGPYFPDEKGKKRRTYLVAIIDDHSRFIVGYYWSFHENTVALEMALKHGIMLGGRPDALYTDNGSPFITQHLSLICARLGIALIHSRPHDAPGRGKVERVFRTVQEQWLVLHKADTISFDAFKESFHAWLNQEYHKNFHSGINTTPLQRYTEGMQKRPLKRITQEELDLAFYFTLTRRVKNDSTISIYNKLYEVPSRFIGMKVELRHPTSEPEKLTLWENGDPVCRLNLVNVNENADFHTRGIRFSLEQEDDKS
jgi:putative transposase